MQCASGGTEGLLPADDDALAVPRVAEPPSRACSGSGTLALDALQETPTYARIEGPRNEYFNFEQTLTKLKRILIL